MRAVAVLDAPVTDLSASSPLPLLVISLPELRVRTANAAAVEFFGLEQSELVSRCLSDLFAEADTEKATSAMCALADGAIDAYRSRCQYIGPGGTTDASVWVRTIPRKTGRTALMLILPDDFESLFVPPTRAVMGPLAVDLALGTIDQAGRVTTVFRSNPRVLTSHSTHMKRKWALVSQIHPEDQPRLERALDRFDRRRDDLIVTLRISHEQLGWITAQCHLFSMGDETSDDAIGFVLAEAAVRTSTLGRIAQLEQHLARIALETQSAGLSSRSLDPSEGRAATDLSGLTPRQRDIVNRILDGARVATVADALFISQSTVRNHLSTVYRALSVHSQAELIDLLRPAG